MNNQIYWFTLANGQQIPMTYQQALESASRARKVIDQARAK